MTDLMLNLTPQQLEAIAAVLLVAGYAVMIAALVARH